MRHPGILSCSFGACGAKRRMCIVPVRQCTGRHRVHMHFAAFQFIPGAGRPCRPTAASSQVDPCGSTVPENTGQVLAQNPFRLPSAPPVDGCPHTNERHPRHADPSILVRAKALSRHKTTITRKQPSFRCNADHFLRKRNGNTPLRQRRLVLRALLPFRPSFRASPSPLAEKH